MKTSRKTRNGFSTSKEPRLRSVKSSTLHGSRSAYTTKPDLIHRKASCACGGGCSGCQSKSSGLKLSQPNDSAEIEADRMADRVMRMTVGEAGKQAPRLISGSIPSGTSAATIHRKCGTCEDEEEKTIHRKPLPVGGGGVNGGPAHIREATYAGGRPLDLKTRNFFEPRLGYDLGSVRVHTGGAASSSAKAIDARAYTLGRDIVFGHGEYKPESETGKHLIAHELAHAIHHQPNQNTIHRATVDCKPPIPTGEHLYGGNDSLARRSLFMNDEAKSPDTTTISNFPTLGLKAHTELKNKLRDLKLNPDIEARQPAEVCSTGFRLPYPEGNALGLEAVELCERGGMVYFEFYCKDQSSTESCADKSPQELIDSGMVRRSDKEQEMRGLMTRIHGTAAGNNTTAIVFACDAENNSFYYLAASSAPGQMPKGPREAAQAEGVDYTFSNQTKLASRLIKSEADKAKLRQALPAEADQILADLSSPHTPTKEAAQLRVYAAFEEVFPNLHAEREAIYAVQDKGDKAIFVMPSRDACDVCQQFIEQFGVILLKRGAP